MRFATTMTVPCTPAKLWTLLTDPVLIKTWLEDLVDDTPDDPSRTSGVGVRSTMRIREGRKVQTYQSVTTAWVPERHVAIRLTGGSFANGMAMDVDYRIAPEGTGSRLDYVVDVPLKGIFVLMAPLIWIGSRSNASKALAKLAEVAAK